jgi:hypothetical protein
LEELKMMMVFSEDKGGGGGLGNVIRVQRQLEIE